MIVDYAIIYLAHKGDTGTRLRRLLYTSREAGDLIRHYGQGDYSEVPYFSDGAGGIRRNIEQSRHAIENELYGCVP